MSSRGAALQASVAKSCMPPKALSRFAERGAGWRTPSPTSALDFSLRTKTATRTRAAVVYPSWRRGAGPSVAKWVASSDFRQLTVLPPYSVRWGKKEQGSPPVRSYRERESVLSADCCAALPLFLHSTRHNSHQNSTVAVHCRRPAELQYRRTDRTVDGQYM